MDHRSAARVLPLGLQHCPGALLTSSLSDKFAITSVVGLGSRSRPRERRAWT